jgi:hypothetical protein
LVVANKRIHGALSRMPSGLALQPRVRLLKNVRILPPDLSAFCWHTQFEAAFRQNVGEFGRRNCVPKYG